MIRLTGARMEKQYGSRVENKIFTNLFNSRTFLVSPWKSLLKLDARFKFSRISKLHPTLGGIFYFDFEKGPRLIRIIAIEFKAHLQEFPSFTFPYFSGHDLSARFRHKISRLVKYVELFGGFSMGRKTGRLWIARVQKERRVRTVRRHEEVSR